MIMKRTFMKRAINLELFVEVDELSEDDLKFIDDSDSILKLKEYSKEQIASLFTEAEYIEQLFMDSDLYFRISNVSIISLTEEDITNE